MITKGKVLRYFYCLSYSMKEQLGVSACKLQQMQADRLQTLLKLQKLPIGVLHIFMQSTYAIIYNTIFCKTFLLCFVSNVLADCR